MVRNDLMWEWQWTGHYRLEAALQSFRDGAPTLVNKPRVDANAQTLFRSVKSLRMGFRLRRGRPSGLPLRPPVSVSGHTKQAFDLTGNPTSSSLRTRCSVVAVIQEEFMKVRFFTPTIIVMRHHFNGIIGHWTKILENVGLFVYFDITIFGPHFLAVFHDGYILKLSFVCFIILQKKRI